MDEYLMKLDIDDKGSDSIVLVFDRLMILKKHFGLYDIRSETKDTNKGRHIRIWFKTKNKIDDRDLVFFQLVLGSDPMREIFNWIRVRQGWKHWNALFEKKYIMDCNSLELVSHEREIGRREDDDRTSEKVQTEEKESI